MSSSIYRRGGIKIILWTCLLVGTLDIFAAMIDAFFRYGTTPIELFQFIASGILGVSSFSDGLLSALLGLCCHYFIASTWTTIFFIFYPKLNLSPKLKIVSGLIYGIVIWLVMNLIIVPLSNTHKMIFHFGHAITGALYLMFLIGLPASLIFHKYYITNADK